MFNRDAPIPPSKKRDEQTIKLMQFFFARMVEEEHTEECDIHQYLPEYFLSWLGGRLLAFDQADTLKAAGDLDDMAWDFLHELVAGPDGVLKVAPIWPLVALHHRGTPKHKVKRVHHLFMITYEDGTIMPLSTSQIPELHSVLNGSEVPFCDGMLAAQAMSSHRSFLKEVFENGIDGLHDRGTNYGGDYPYEVLIGAFLRIIPQLKPELHTHLRMYADLVRNIVCPPVPPDAKRALEAAAKRKSGDISTSGPRGGWDV